MKKFMSRFALAVVSTGLVVAVTGCNTDDYTSEKVVVERPRPGYETVVSTTPENKTHWWSLPPSTTVKTRPDAGVPLVK